jgi:hypothetical protein
LTYHAGPAGAIRPGLSLSGDAAKKVVQQRVNKFVCQRLVRVSLDPADDGAEDVFRVGDRVRQWFYQRIVLSDLLSVSSSASPKSTGW